VAHADDNFGLQADLVVPAARQSYWMVRYENLSPVGGEAVLRATTSGILQGTVRTREGALVPQARTVSVFRRNGNFWGFHAQTSTDATGAFSVAVTQSGVYASRTVRSPWDTSIHVDQVFENINCTSGGSDLLTCANGQITEIPHNGLETRNITFQLDRGAKVGGIVRNNLGTALADASVELRLTNDSFNYSTRSDALGRYQFQGLTPSEARLRASALQHRTTMHRDIVCGNNCAFPSLGTPVPLTVDGNISVDFALPISSLVTVTLNLSNDQIANFANTTFNVSALRSDGTVAANTTTTGGSPTANLSDLPTGDYFILATSLQTYPMLYPDIECATDCIAELAQAEPIRIDAGSVIIPLQMSLRRLPNVFGTLRDSVSGNAIKLSRLFVGHRVPRNF
jgi:hypothetical protein